MNIVCSARLQAGIFPISSCDPEGRYFLLSSRCPPEGGRYLAPIPAEIHGCANMNASSSGKLIMPTRILGIESSCDETAAAVVVDGREILSSVVSSQLDIHRKYGGIVPELASREHLRQIVPV